MLLLNRLVVPLVLTIGIELLVMVIITGLKFRLLLGVVAVNMATNPLLNFVLYVSSHFILITQTGLIVILLEILVVFVEWRLLLYIYKEKTARIFYCSFLMNFASYLAGVIFF